MRALTLIFRQRLGRARALRPGKGPPHVATRPVGSVRCRQAGASGLGRARGHPHHYGLTGLTRADFDHLTIHTAAQPPAPTPIEA